MSERLRGLRGRKSACLPVGCARPVRSLHSQGRIRSTARNRLLSFAAIVADYIANRQQDAVAERRYYATLPTLRDAVREAALCRYWSNEDKRYKRHPHQFRIAKKALKTAARKLRAKVDFISKSSSFENLHSLIRDHIGIIKGIGPLTVYDVAHRIGAYLNLSPKLIYLHAGTLTGAKAFKLRGECISPAMLPAPFRRLSAAEIEDCLCVYKDRFQRITKLRSP